MSQSFLSIIRDDIRAGLSHAPQTFRQKHVRWIQARQLPEGGFANRRGNAELYYTAFALRSLSALDALDRDGAGRAAAFLRDRFNQSDVIRQRQPEGVFCDAVAAVSWWDSLALCEEASGPQLAAGEREAARVSACARLDKLRRVDGGWAKTDMDSAGSLYHTFLASCAYAAMGLEVPGAAALDAFLRQLAQEGGGFLENRYSKRPGTNGTAAGVALSILLGKEDGLARHGEFVLSMHGSEGGFHATPAAPIADLLSTYTALFTLKLTGLSRSDITEKALKYVRKLEQPDGGYVGFALETIVDCEYAFYGIGAESLSGVWGPGSGV